MSYSQGDEEKYILHAVKHIAKGRFLDIGAWNATTLSNTRALFELGWSGVLIEPSPEPFLGLLREYGTEGRIQLICGAVGRNSEITRFHATADAVSTSSDESYERWKSVGGFYGRFYTNVITMAQLWQEFGSFDFVSIDTEGTSVDLLHALLELPMLPTCICVEYDSRGQECMDAACNHGYRVIDTSSENVVFSR